MSLYENTSTVADWAWIDPWFTPLRVLDAVDNAARVSLTLSFPTQRKASTVGEGEETVNFGKGVKTAGAAIVKTLPLTKEA